jgi:hypothetical protein
LSKEDKKELRKLRNRELASESRKRKSDEMSRLKDENEALKERLAALEQYVPVEVLAEQHKRQRATALSGSVAAALTWFVSFACSYASLITSGHVWKIFFCFARPSQSISILYTRRYSSRREMVDLLI